MARIIDAIKIMIGADGSQFKREMQVDQAEIDKFAEKVDGIRSKSVNIQLNDAKAQAKIDEFNAHLEAIQRQAIYLDADDEKAKLKLDILKADLDTLTKKTEKIRVDVTTRGDLEKLLALRAEMDLLRNEGNSGASNAGGAGGAAAAAGTGGASILGPMLALLSPLAAPLGAGLVGGVMGLASAFTAATAGAAGFGIVAKSALSPVLTASSNLTKDMQAYNDATTSKARQAALQKEADVWKNLTTEQRNALTELQGFKSFWNGWTKQFSGGVLNVFALGLRGLRSILTDTTPVIKASAGAFGTLFKEMDSALGTSDNKQFFQWLAKQATPAILAFGHATGNVMRGVANLMMAFTGPAHSMENGLVNLTYRFYKWTDALSNSKGFHEFVSYFLQNGPLLLATLGNLAAAILHIIIAMAPVGHVMLVAVNAIAKFVSWILTSHKEVGRLVGGLIPALGAFKLVGMALKLLPEEALAALGPIGWILDAIIVVAMLVITHWKEVKKVTLEVWHAIANAIRAAWGFIGPRIVQGMEAIRKYWNSVWPELKEVFQGVWLAIKVTLGPYLIWMWITIKAIMGFIQGAWHNGWLAVWDFLKMVWDNIRLVVRVGLDVISGLFKIILDLLTGHWRKAWTDMINTTKYVWRDIKQWFTSMERDGLSFGRNFVLMIAKGIEGAAVSVYNAAKGVASRLKHWLGFHSPSKGLPDSAQWAPNFMKMFIEGVQQKIPELDKVLAAAMSPSKFNFSSNVAAMVGGYGRALVNSNNTTQHHQEIHNHFVIQGATPSEENNIRKLAKQLAIYQQQKQLSVGVIPE